MANIFTTSTPAFKRQSLTEFFLKPMFLGDDIRNQVTVRTGVKGTELLNHISAPSMITRKKTTPGFTPRGAFELTTQEITVSPMAIEFEQNAREFWDTIIQQLLASGYKEDDIEKMPESDFWNKIVLPMIARAGRQDLIRQMWFGDTSLSSDDWNGYNGFLKSINNVISSENNKTLGTSAKTGTVTYKATGTAATGETITITINGVDYTSTTIDDRIDHVLSTWRNDHETALNALGITLAVSVLYPTYSQVILTGPAATPMVTSGTYTSTGGTLTKSDEVIGNPASFADDDVDETMNEILDSTTPELMEFDPVFYLSYKAWRNLFQTWKNLGTDKANIIRWKGIDVPSYEGFPIMVRPDWDKWDKVLGTPTPGRILFTSPKNLVFATDGALDSDMVESWYNQDEQKRRYRVQYKAATAALHSELLLGANL